MTSVRAWTADAVGGPEELQMLLDGEGVMEHRVLRTAAQQARPLHHAAVRGEVPGQDAQQGALVGTVLADDAHQLTRVEIQRHPAQDRTVPVALADIPNPQHRLTT